MEKLKILKEMSFGHRVAEEEVNELANYFVETEQWRQIFDGEIDIVYGPKGSGKSAIYTLLLNRKEILAKKNTFIIPAENPQGEIVFRDLTVSPPTSENEFRALWKIYFLILIGNFFQTRRIRGTESERVVNFLAEAELIRPNSDLAQLFRNGRNYIRKFFNPKSIEGGVEIDPNTGMIKGLKGKITPNDPTREEEKRGLVSIDELITTSNKALVNTNIKIWLILDRLDAAFEQHEELEGNALRALFRVYIDSRVYSNISLKIFLRSDIWKKIAEGGFREASHITRQISISWDNVSLLNLIVKRLIRNKSIVENYGIDDPQTTMPYVSQEKLFYQIFPNQVEAGKKKPKTLDWLLSRTCDGTKQTAPRELIHLLTAAKNKQIQRIENGQAMPAEEKLFDGMSLGEALPEVSKVRLNQTFYAEYPKYRELIQKLEGEKAEQNAQELSSIWQVSVKEALETANELTELGFFEKRGSKESPSFWTPFLYREELKMIQGKSF